MPALNEDQADHRHEVVKDIEKVVVHVGIEEIEVDLTVPRHIRVHGVTPNGKPVERLLNITERGGISLV